MNRETELLGAFGEHMAAMYLEKKHYKLLAMNVVGRFGEIDIIAQNWRFVVFVEVKLRKDARVAQAREFVNQRKRDKIRMTASMYLERHPNRRQPRFDVIEVYAPEGYHTAHPEIYHVEDAF